MVGGCAIDLRLGERSRPNGDLEIALPRSEFPRVTQALSGFRLFAVGAGEVRALAAGASPALEKHQIRVLDEPEGGWRMDVMLEPGDAKAWVFRRDERIREARVRMLGRRRDVPCLRPEGVPLYEANARREKDEADFGVCLGRLGADAAQWLRVGLETAHPGHPGIDRLSSRRPGDGDTKRSRPRSRRDWGCGPEFS